MKTAKQLCEENADRSLINIINWISQQRDLTTSLSEDHQEFKDIKNNTNNIKDKLIELGFNIELKSHKYLTSKGYATKTIPATKFLGFTLIKECNVVDFSREILVESCEEWFVISACCGNENEV